MFHCFLGKDRTGITAALILHLTGVYFEDIVADYRISSTYLEPFYRREMERKRGLSMRATCRISAPRRSNTTRSV